MGKVDRLRNKVETLAVLFWALGHVRLYCTSQHLALHAGRALLHRHTHKTCPYLVIVGSTLSEDAPATPFYRMTFMDLTVITSSPMLIAKY